MKFHNIKDLLEFTKKKKKKTSRVAQAIILRTLGCALQLCFFFFPKQTLKEESDGFLQPFPCSRDRSWESMLSLANGTEIAKVFYTEYIQSTDSSISRLPPQESN